MRYFNQKELILEHKAYAKGSYFAQKMNLECGGFGIAAKDNPLCITDLKLLPCISTGASLEFTDHAMSNWLYELGQQGLTHETGARVWWHWHPGNATPSSTDYEQFQRLCNDFPWLVMLIFGSMGNVSAVMGREYNNQILTSELDIEIQTLELPEEKEWLSEYNKTVLKNNKQFKRNKAAYLADHANRDVDFLPLHANISEKEIRLVDWDKKEATTNVTINRLDVRGIQYKGKIYQPKDFALLTTAMDNNQQSDPIIEEGNKLSEMASNDFKNMTKRERRKFKQTLKARKKVT